MEWMSFGVGFAVGVVITLAIMCWAIAVAFPPTHKAENRAASAARIADNERARDEALRRIAERQRHAQRQRNASAEITRGL